MRIPAKIWRHRDGMLAALVAGAALLMIGLTWGLTLLSVRAELRAALTDAKAGTRNLALAIQLPLSLQLRAVDRVADRVAAEWKAKDGSLDQAWRITELRSDVPHDVAVTNAQGLVVAATWPERLGTSLARHRSFEAQRDGGRPGLFIVASPLGGKTSERWSFEASRRLELPGGGFAGAVVINFAPEELTSMLGQVDLGQRGTMALVGDDGSIRAMTPQDDALETANIAASPMFRAQRTDQNGSWTGPSAPDGIVRVHAFRRIAGRDLTLMVGVDRKVALRPGAAWEATASWLAGGMTIAIMAIAILLWRVQAAAHSRADQAASDRARLMIAYTQAKRAEAHAAGKAGQLTGVIDGMSDGVLLLDDQLQLAVWNERFALYTGTPRELLQAGTPISELLRAQIRAGEFGPIRDDAAIEAEVERRIELLRTEQLSGAAERTRPNGRSIELRRTALPGGGSVTLYTDITARRQTEAARAEARRLEAQAAEQKANFVAVVSHEIRTPLNAVLGSLALLEQSALSKSQLRLAATALQAGRALLDLVNDVLELSRTRAGRLQLHPTRFEPAALMDGIATMCAAAAAARGMRLVVEQDPSVLGTLQADSGRLRQILINLVSNAVKFALPGPVVISASICRAPAGGAEMVRFAVSDSGKLLAPADRARLFQPFSQLRARGRPCGGGTGLGLAISARLVHLMGGEIGVEDAATGGNAFWFTVPLQPASLAVADRETTASPARSMRDLRRTARATILLVEDTLASAVLTATLLRRAGHAVDVAESGGLAVDMVQRRPYDVVLMDLVMPQMSGFEATGRIRALPGIAGAVPIVALTATTAPDDLERCEQAGVDTVLAKPVALSDLLHAVGRVTSPLGADDGLRHRRTAEVAATAQVLDPARLAELRQALAPARLVGLVEQCLADCQLRLPALHEALAEGDVQAAEAAAHALAGMAATYGLARLEARLRAVMAASRAHDLGLARMVAVRLPAELAATSAAMRASLAADSVTA